MITAELYKLKLSEDLKKLEDIKTEFLHLINPELLVDESVVQKVSKDDYLILSSLCNHHLNEGERLENGKIVLKFPDFPSVEIMIYRKENQTINQKNNQFSNLYRFLENRYEHVIEYHSINEFKQFSFFQD